MKRSRRILVAHYVLMLWPAVGLAAECPDVSGRFAVFGEWLEHSPDNVSNEPPRVDELAFKFVARRIAKPKAATVKYSAQQGDLTINVEGSGIDTRWPNVLPIRRRVRCTDQGWLLEGRSAGGGDNTLSTSTYRVLIRIGNEGSLSVFGEEHYEIGLLFRSKSSRLWSAKFPRLPE
jgi:hypothetical protein